MPSLDTKGFNQGKYVIGAFLLKAHSGCVCKRVDGVIWVGTERSVFRLMLCPGKKLLVMPGVVVHACNPTSWEAEAGRPRIPGKPMSQNTKKKEEEEEKEEEKKGKREKKEEKEKEEKLVVEVAWWQRKIKGIFRSWSNGGRNRVRSNEVKRRNT